MGKVVRLIAMIVVLSAVVALSGCASGASSSSAGSSSGSESSSGVESSAVSSASSGSVSSSASSASSDASTSQGQTLANGVYEATFKTDSSMFHVNEADNGKGELTVSDDGMVIHVHLVSKKIVNLYLGKAADAETDSAHVIQPTTDTVTYSDGYKEEVYGFDIPVPALEEEFDVAILGEKGTWYDHKVSVSDPVAKQ